MSRCYASARLKLATAAHTVLQTLVPHKQQKRNQQRLKYYILLVLHVSREIRRNHYNYMGYIYLRASFLRATRSSVRHLLWLQQKIERREQDSGKWKTQATQMITESMMNPCEKNRFFVLYLSNYPTVRNGFDIKNEKFTVELCIMVDGLSLSKCQHAYSLFYFIFLKKRANVNVAVN